MNWTDMNSIDSFHRRIFGDSTLEIIEQRKTVLNKDLEFKTKLPLREDQKIASQFLKSSKKALLSLGAGFGKTAICLAYFGLLAPDIVDDEISFNSWKNSLKKNKKSKRDLEVSIDDFDFGFSENKPKRKTNFKAIVVTTSSLVNQWGTEVEKFTSFTYHCVSSKSGSKSSRAQIYEDFITNDVNILILNFEKVLKDFVYLKAIVDSGIDTIVFDEPTPLMQSENQVFKFYRQLTASIPRCVLVTATPIVNNLLEVYNLFQILHLDKFLPSREVFERDFLVFKEFKIYKDTYSFDVRQPKSSKNIKQFRKLVDPFLLYKEAAANPSLQNVGHEYKAIKVKLTEEQAYLCEQIKADLKQTLKDYEKYIQLQKEFEYMENNCAIVGNPTLEERYSFLRDFLKEPPKVPRAASAYQQLIKVTDFPILFDSSKSKLSPKINEMCELILSNPSKKYVIFVQYVETIKLIYEVFDKLGIKHLTIMGEVDSAKREKIKNDFNAYEGQICLLMTKAGRFGLNLQSASEVILLSLPWTPSDVQQLLARCFRTGQKNDVTAWFFITENSIEEQIFDDVLLRKQKEIDEFTNSQDKEIFLKQKVINSNSFLKKNYLQGPFYSKSFLYS